MNITKLIEKFEKDLKVAEKDTESFKNDNFNLFFRGQMITLKYVITLLMEVKE